MIYVSLVQHISSPFIHWWLELIFPFVIVLFFFFFIIEIANVIRALYVEFWCSKEVISFISLQNCNKTKAGDNLWRLQSEIKKIRI